MSDGLRVAEMDLDDLITREWLATNGIGGYASSSVASLNTRRYHGLLVAAMAPPVRRMVLLSRLEETVRISGREFYLASNEYPGTIWPRGHEHLRAFAADPFPRWAYQGDGWTILKHLAMLRGENTTIVSYTLLGGGQSVELELQPLFALRGIHELCYQWNGRLVAEPRSQGHWRVPATSRTPDVFFAHDGTFDRRPNWFLNTIYRREQERGYAGLEDLWSPGTAHIKLLPGQTVHFACSSEPLDLAAAVQRSQRQGGAELVAVSARQACLAASVAGPDGGPAGTPDPALEALCRASDAFILGGGPDGPIAAAPQYHWSPPSPRAALIAFTGLHLVNARFDEARQLLESLAAQLKDGLLPSVLPEDGSAPIYGGADVSLWFVNSVHQYLDYSGEEASLRGSLTDAAFQIVEAYASGGAGPGVGLDADGLLVCRAPALARPGWTRRWATGSSRRARGGRSS